MTQVPWQPISMDAGLSGIPASVGPGNVPQGDDLRLDIGWDKFEQLMLGVAREVLGLHQVRFRRYGTPGQAQYGIDLAGRRPDGGYTVIQCKEVQDFSAGDLRAAVEKFTKGPRPFDANQFVIAVSSPDAGKTQVDDELANLRNEHPDLTLDLWGPAQINEALRYRADIVSRFWTRETADTFCTGVSLTGVPAADPNWARVADQVLLGPLAIDGLATELAEADKSCPSEPAKAAEAYGSIAVRLAEEGFAGHAFVLRRRQLDALIQAQDVEGSAALAASLAAIALHEADLHQAEQLSRLLDSLVRPLTAPPPGIEPPAPSPAVRRHVQLIGAAVFAAEHQLGDSSMLASALRGESSEWVAPDYQPMLVLLLAELRAADVLINPTGLLFGSGELPPADVADLDDLVRAALEQLAACPQPAPHDDLALRLRMVRAEYDEGERSALVAEARQLRLPRPQAALVLASQARRDADEGSADEALEHWRQAVSFAVLDGRTEEASAWLYAIRGLKVRYGPWTENLEEEHLLAQALPKSTSGRLIRRVRDVEADARIAILAGRPIEAIRSARRWLADSLVMGDWVDAGTAAEVLGDLYAANAEPVGAMCCYLWAGSEKKSTDLAKAAGDILLAVAPAEAEPWWRRATVLDVLAVQRDLLPDVKAAELLPRLLDLSRRARGGELVDGPTHGLAIGLLKTTALFADRGSPEDALAVLDMMAEDVARQRNQYKHWDAEHVEACRAIARNHVSARWSAIVRLMDLAEAGTNEALNAITKPWVLDLLRESDEHGSGTPIPLSSEQRSAIRARLHDMQASGLYNASIALALLGEVESVADAAAQARDRLLSRPEPDGHTTAFGTRMGADSFLASFLSIEDQHACLDKLLTVGADRREAAVNRQEALIAASNLVIDQPDLVRSDVHLRSRAFVLREHDGSYLDDEVTNPHPLSTFKVNFGPSSLAAAALRLAENSSATPEQRHWVREQASGLLGSNDPVEVNAAALTLSRLGAEALKGLDASLLATHSAPVVRQLAVVVAVGDTSLWGPTLSVLARDHDSSVRRLLAARLREKATAAGMDDHDPVVGSLLDDLSEDVRRPVRQAAQGLELD